MPNDSEWARESIGALRNEVRDVRRELGRERERSDLHRQDVTRQLVDIKDTLSELRGASKLAGAIWGGTSGMLIAWASTWLYRK